MTGVATMDCQLHVLHALAALQADWHLYIRAMPPALVDVLATLAIPISRFILPVSYDGRAFSRTINYE